MVKLSPERGLFPRWFGFTVLSEPPGSGFTFSTGTNELVELRPGTDY